MEKEKNNTQDELVRGLAHRMNNILTLFHGYVGLMLDNAALDKTTRGNLLKIKDGATAAGELMDRTHALVRPNPAIAREFDLPFFMALHQPAMERMCAVGTTLELLVPSDLPAIKTDASKV